MNAPLINGSSEKKDVNLSLKFKHLSEYARFLLENELDEFTKVVIAYSREEKIPLLKLLGHLSERELYETSRASTENLLRSLAENKAGEYIEISRTNYIKSIIPYFERESVVIEDITLISLVRKKAFRKFISNYTSDINTFSLIIEEIDHFFSASEIASFNAFLEIQQVKIKRINTELAQKQDDLLEAQELADMGSFYWNLKKGTSTHTPGISKIFEMEEENLPLESFMQYVVKADREKLDEAIRISCTTGEIFNCEYRYKRNQHLKYLWSRGVVSFKDGEAVGMKGTVMDLTQKHLTLQKLQESEEMNKRSQALTHIGNWTWDIIRNSVFWSDEMYRIYGLKPQSEKITFEKFMSFVHEDDRERRKAEIENSLKTKVVKEYNMRIVNPDGTIKVLRGRGNIIVDSNDIPVKLVGTCQDITIEHNKNLELKKLNASLKVKNIELETANKELESFNYIASHDLQEPLRKIETFANRILEERKLIVAPPILGYVKKILSSSYRMKTLIKDLLKFSQDTQQETNTTKVDLNEVMFDVKDALSNLIEEKKAIINKNELPVVEGVHFQLHQLLLNIVGNALKYSKPNVVPVINVSCITVEGIEIKDPLAIDGVMYNKLTFEDNGIGFENENKDKIFGLFQRLHTKDAYSGTGIGLAICKKITQNHKGFIVAESIPNKGAAFHVYLPKSAASFVLN